MTHRAASVAVIVAGFLAVSLLSRDAAAGSRRRSPVRLDLDRGRVSVDTSRARARADEHVRRGVSRADRAARAAGVRISVRDDDNDRRRRARPLHPAAQRREEVRAAYKRRLLGGDRRPGRR